MPEAVIIGIAGTVGTVLVAIIGKAASGKDSANAFLEKVMGRLEDLEADVAELHQDVDRERAARFAQERRSNGLQLALARGLHTLRGVADWISAGAMPPPPDVTKTIVELEIAIKPPDDGTV